MGGSLFRWEDVQHAHQHQLQSQSQSQPGDTDQTVNARASGSYSFNQGGHPILTDIRAYEERCSDAGLGRGLDRSMNV